MAQPPTSPSRGISIPLTKRNGSSPFGPVEIANEIERTVAKIRRSVSIYRNNTGTDHPLSDIIKTIDKRDSNSGSLLLADYEHDGWYGGVFIGEAKPGTSPQLLDVLIDLGSTDFLVRSTLCKMDCEGFTLYDPSMSSTMVAAKPPFNTFKAGYGDSLHRNVVTGKIYYDQVTVAAGLTVKSQPIGAAVEWSPAFIPYADGIMGLAFPSMSRLKGKSILHKLADDNHMNPEFGIMLRPSSYSVLCIGFLDESLYQGDITWVDTIDKHHWWAPVNEVLVDGTPVSRGIRAMFDSGSTLIYGDDTTIKEIYLYITRSKMVDNTYHMPCKAENSVSFVINGKIFEVPHTVFVGDPVELGSNTCYGGAVPSTAFSQRFLILGNIFLQNFFSAYQYKSPEGGRPRIGLAALRGST